MCSYFNLTKLEPWMENRPFLLDWQYFYQTDSENGVGQSQRDF